MRSYEAARSLFTFLAFIAWSVVVIGVIVALISASGASRYGGGGAGLIAMVPGIGIGITGFILVAFVQMGRANVDTAEYTQQMLKLSRDQLEVSKQGLKLQSAAPQSFAAVAQNDSPKSQSKRPVPEGNKISAIQKNAEALPKPDGHEIPYKHEIIFEKDGRYQIGTATYFNLEQAQEHVDRETVNTSQEATE